MVASDTTFSDVRTSGMAKEMSRCSVAPYVSEKVDCVTDALIALFVVMTSSAAAAQLRSRRA